jgi:hypothetical protein
VSRSVKRGWLERVGLKAKEPSRGDWVVVDKGPVDSRVSSSYADELVERLTEAGIDARTEPYVLPDAGAGFSRAASTGPSARERVLVAVLVRRRDQARAKAVVDSRQVEPISDEELTRLAEEAGRSPLE